MSTAAKLALLLLSGSCIAALAACSSARPAQTPPPSSVQSRIDGFKVNDDDYRKIGYKRDWTGYPFVSGGGRINTLHSFGDIVVVQESGSTVTVLDAQNGTVKWSNTVAGPLTRFVSVERHQDVLRGDCILALADSDIYFLNSATGNQITRQKIEKVVSTAPIMLSDAAVFATPTGEILAHSFSSGMKAWGLGTQTSISANPVFIQGQAGVVMQNGAVLFVDTASGTITSRARIFGGSETNPVVNGALMIVASTDQSLYGISIGGIEWRVRTSAPLVLQHAAHKNKVYVTTSDWGFSCFEGSSGKRLWSAPKISGVPIGIRAGMLLIWDNGSIIRLDAARGDFVDRTPMPTVRSVTTDSFEDGNLFIISETGIVTRLNPRQ